MYFIDERCQVTTIFFFFQDLFSLKLQDFFTWETNRFHFFHGFLFPPETKSGFMRKDHFHV